jgi:hypothetical protein
LLEDLLEWARSLPECDHPGRHRVLVGPRVVKRKMLVCDVCGDVEETGQTVVDFT